jgi:mannose-6-phosphate isomerase-like protein (cupin superfamily)
MEQGKTHLGPEEGRSVWVLGSRLTYKVTAAQTGGAYSLFEGLVPARGETPPHIHHREDECFYVLEGEFEFSKGDDTVKAGAGSLVYVPKGTLHGVRNVGEGEGRLLNSQTPGGLHERFYEEAAEGSPDLERVAQIAARYGTEMPVPPRA